jgi:hypothetical protein
MIQKKPKKKALWLTAFPEQAVKTMTKPEKLKRLRKAVRLVSKRRQAVTAEYREKARAFVAAAIARGETCPVVAAIEDLRESVRYGWPCCNRLNEVHHTRGRAGSLLLDERFWLALSKQGHRWVHENPEEARAHGWICEPGDWGRPGKLNEISPFSPLKNSSK